MSDFVYPQGTPAPGQPYASQPHGPYQVQPPMPGAGQTMAQAYHPAYPPVAMSMQGRMPQTPASPSFFNLGNDRFLKGLLIGAAAAYLLTNESVQRNAIKGVVKLWGGIQGGVEEIKERFHDAEAELQASESHKDA